MHRLCIPACTLSDRVQRRLATSWTFARIWALKGRIWAIVFPTPPSPMLPAKRILRVPTCRGVSGRGPEICLAFNTGAGTAGRRPNLSLDRPSSSEYSVCRNPSRSWTAPPSSTFYIESYPGDTPSGRRPKIRLSWKGLGSKWRPQDTHRRVWLGTPTRPAPGELSSFSIVQPELVLQPELLRSAMFLAPLVSTRSPSRRSRMRSSGCTGPR